MRADPYVKGLDLKQVAALASDARGVDTFGYRAEFVQMVKLAQSLPALASLRNTGSGGPPRD